MKFLIYSALFFFSVSLNAQTVKELEAILSKKFVTGKNKEKAIARQVLAQDKYNETAINYLVESYLYRKDKDSVKYFFDLLVASDSLNPLVYVLKGKYERYKRWSMVDWAGIYSKENDDQEIKSIGCFKKAISMDSKYVYAWQSLAGLYYSRFVRMNKWNDSKGKYDHKFTPASEVQETALLAKETIKKVVSCDNSLLAQYKYALIQVSYFLRDTGDVAQFNVPDTGAEYDTAGTKKYFPVETFMALDNGWQTNYSKDLLSGMNFEIWMDRFNAKSRSGLGEPVLHDLDTQQEAYRFTWFRYTNAIIRIEKNKDLYKVYWKTMARHGMSGGEIPPINKEKEISKQDWDNFCAVLKENDFWNMPLNDKNVMGVADGGKYLFEGYRNGRYYALDRWVGTSSEFEKISSCLKTFTDLLY